SNPAVVRLRNVTSSSFQIKMTAASEGGVSGVSVHYLVVEEGVYESPRMEARRVLSDDNNRSGVWRKRRMEEYLYANTYEKPVVLGQVMTHNDPGFSVFWSRRGWKRQARPSATSCYVGRHVAEDPQKTRAPETLGVIVIESGSGMLGGIPYSAGYGPTSVRGVGDSPGYTYPVGEVVAPQTVVLSSAGMRANNGGWPILYGSFPVSSNGVEVAVDEDMLKDSERRHGEEKLAYIVMGAQ
ncbi:MAG: hypothetical protein AAF699_15040, partial [Pseudomonadota bacterium]